MPHKYASISIFSTAWCPLNCRYCYIPKTPIMLDMHRDIVEGITSKGIENYLHLLDSRKGYSVQLWGAEPMVSLKDLAPSLPLLAERGVREIFFSTSLILDPSVVVDFIRAADEAGISIRVQISLDGPPEITDYTRGPGIADRVVSNLERLIAELSELCPAHRVWLNFKPTWTSRELELFQKDPMLLDRFISYFRQIVVRLARINTCDAVVLPRVPMPTFETPGNYTPQHGRIFANLIRALSSKHAYVLRLAIANVGLLRGMYPGCRAGDGFVGMTQDRLVLCHRLFFLLDDRYVRSLDTVRDLNYDADRVDVGIHRLIKNYYSANTADPRAVLRFQRSSLAYHGFGLSKIVASSILAKWLARTGVILPKYARDRYAYRLAHTVWAVNGCHADAVLGTGTPYTPRFSIFTLFGNGADDEIWRAVHGESTI